MLISRRKFTQGAAALSSAAAMPPIPLSMQSGGEDAYSAIVSELARVEEAAHAVGSSLPGGGAVSATGRQLESFLGHMDMQVKPYESATQVYREMRGYLREQAKRATQQIQDEVKRTAEDAVSRDDVESRTKDISDTKLDSQD